MDFMLWDYGWPHPLGGDFSPISFFLFFFPLTGAQDVNVYLHLCCTVSAGAEMFIGCVWCGAEESLSEVIVEGEGRRSRSQLATLSLGLCSSVMGPAKTCQPQKNTEEKTKSCVVCFFFFYLPCQANFNSASSCFIQCLTSQCRRGCWQCWQF